MLVAWVNPRTTVHRRYGGSSVRAWLWDRSAASLLGRQPDRQMARPLADASRAALSPWPKTAQRGPLVGVDLLHVQVVAQQLMVVLRVCDRRVEHALDVPCDTARAVAQQRARVGHRASAHVIHHEPRLARGRPHVLGLGADQGALWRGTLAPGGLGLRSRGLLGGGSRLLRRRAPARSRLRLGL